MLSEAIESIADKVLSLEEADLKSLLHRFKTRMEQGDVTLDWERAVIAYFLISGVRVKNALKQGRKRQKQYSGNYPPLRLIKA
jgi:hypothetical protein